ncbi:hypothetical protein HY522_04590 [bacterium]|nr:hypothetical protein [bacterium]
MNDAPDSAPATPPFFEHARKLPRILKPAGKAALLILLMPFVLTLPVGCMDLQVVSIVGDRVIRQRDIAVSMSTVSDMMNTKRPDIRFDEKLAMEDDRLVRLETTILRDYLADAMDTEHLSLPDAALHDWGRSVGSAGPDRRIVRRPTGFQGYRWWMKENAFFESQ